MSEREHLTLWINDNGVVKLVEGYACPSNPKYWWFPELQYSSQGGRIVKSLAVQDAIKQCRSEISEWTKKLDYLKGEIENE